MRPCWMAKEFIIQARSSVEEGGKANNVPIQGSASVRAHFGLDNGLLLRGSLKSID